MASVAKYIDAAVSNLLRHNNREVRNPANKEIDPARAHHNYRLHNQRGIFSDYSRYKHRKAQLRVYGRADVKTLCGWIVTAPQNLAQEYHQQFFVECYSFLKERYGEANTVQAIVHNDESGEPHLHYCFIPVSEDKKHGGEKICAKEVLTRHELREFHPALQAHLTAMGIPAKIINGATATFGRNRTVSELKRTTVRDRAEHEQNKDISRNIKLNRQKGDFSRDR